MAKYTPITKILKKATPVVRNADGVVKSWDIEVVYSYAGDEAQGLPAWKTTYSENEDVEYMNKTTDQFTKSELIGFMNPMIENSIFEAHYEAFNLPAKEQRVSDFDINSLND
jgi:hypothetical protein